MSLQDLKFSEAEFSGQDVASLPDVPGEAGFTAAQLKARFDNVGKMLVALGKHNELIDALAARGLEKEGELSLESSSGSRITIDDTDWARRTVIGYQDGESYSFHILEESYEDDGGAVMMFLHQNDPVQGGPSLELKAYGLEREALLVRGVAAPQADADAANKIYVDQAVEAVDLRAGGTVTGELTVVNGENSETAAIELRSYVGDWSSYLRIYHDTDGFSFLENHDDSLDAVTSIIIAHPGETSVSLSGAIGGKRYSILLRGVAAPVSDTDAANKIYVDQAVEAVDLRAGGTVTGDLTVVHDENSENATIELLGDTDRGYLRIFHDSDGRAFLQNRSVDFKDVTQIIIPEPGGQWIRLGCEAGGEACDVTLKGVAAPIENNDAANKKYVDDAVDPVDARVAAIEEDCIKASELVALTESEIDSIWVNA